MNKKLFLAIFLMFVLAISSVNVQAASNDNTNIFDYLPSWISSLFSAQQSITYTSSISNSASEVSDESYDYPHIVLSPTQGYVGDIVEIQGKGFRANEEDIIIRFDGIFLGTTVADDNGEFAWLMEVPMPNADKVYYLVEAVDSDGYIVSAQFVILWEEQPEYAKIKLNPDSGYVNDIIEIHGDNFIPNTEILLRFDGENLGTTYADDNGYFVWLFVIPDIAAGNYEIEAVDSDGYIASANLVVLETSVYPQITVTPDEGHVGDEFTIDGKGFRANEEDIIIRFDGIFLGTTVADDNGEFTFNTNVPMPNADKVYYIIEAVDSDGYIVSAQFTILWEEQPDLTLIATPDEGYVGDVINLEGTGYIPGDNLIILFDDEIIVTTSMGSSGSFDTTFVVPDLAPGDYLINVYGTNMSSMYDVFEVFTILDNGTQPDDPSITLSAPVGHVGETRTVFGFDFDDCVPGEIITVRMHGIIIAEFTWYGPEFEEDFVVPDLEPGYYMVTVDNYPTAYAEFIVLEGPYFSELYVDPEQGYVGDVIALWGEEYPANDTLVIMMAGQVIATPTTDMNGAFATTFVVPDIVAGNYEITVVDRAGTANFEVLDNGQGDEEIFVSPSFGYPGDVINVEGNDFGANETLTLYLGPEFIVNVNTDNTGSFTGVFTVPDMNAGLYNVMAVGYSATAPFLVLEQGGQEPDLFVSPNNGYPGDTPYLTGINFGANEDLVILMGGQIIATPTTDANGAFMTTFVVPEWNAGDYEITVFGYTVSEDFTINEWEEEEEEEADDDDDDDYDDVEREQHQYYLEGLTCSADVNAGEKAYLSFEVVNRGITDEDNMIVEVDCSGLGVNVLMENVLIERLEPNYMEIPLNIPADAEEGSYSCMVEIYSDYYAYEHQDRVVDSINVIVGEPFTGTDVIYMDATEEEQGAPDLNVSLFILNIALLGIIVVFIVLTIRSIRK